MEKIYQGSCHCGKNTFELSADLDHVRVCDCSLCRKRGALNFRVREDALKITSPIEEMTLYQWHTKTAKDYFCPTCGILPFRRPRTAPDLWTVNIRCLDDVNLDALPIERVHGSRLD